MIDKPLILRKLTELETYLNQIREYAGISVDQYRADWKIQRIVERTLQVMIETCVDIANHIISDRDLPVPTGYASTFEILNGAGVLSDGLAGTMVRMAKCRNILVHQYTEIDAAIIVSILREHLDDFLAFRDEIVSSLKHGG